MRSKKSKAKLLEKMQDRGLRHDYVAAHIKGTLPEILVNLRDKANISQADLAKRMGKHQTHIARLEHPNYGRFTINTLLEVCKALDVALSVTVVPFSKWLQMTEDLSSERLTPRSFEDEQEKADLALWAYGTKAWTAIPGKASSIPEVKGAVSSGGKL